MKTTMTILLVAASISAKAQNASTYTEAQLDSISRTFDMKELKVKAPSRTRMNGNSMITRIVASPLSGVGNAEDVLLRVPGMIRLQGELQVVGKGTPIYYINGRRVNDLTELQRLSSHDIKDVEVISAPGAQYDAQTNAVVRIRTLRQRGEGLGVSVDLNDQYAPSCGNNKLGTMLNLNYRHESLDVFAGANFDAHHLARYASDVEQTTFSTAQFSQVGTNSMSQQYNGLKYHVGFNWQLAENHSVGAKVERNDNIKGVTNFVMEDDILRNRNVEDHLVSNTHTDANGLDFWLGNVYYNGEVGKLGIDWNADYYTSHENKTATTLEKAYAGSRSVVSDNEADNSLLATKLVMTYPLGAGKLQAGAEFTFMNRDNWYGTTESSIGNDKSKVKENTYAAFVEYGAMIPKAGMLSLGLRYEHVDFKYDNATNASTSQERHLNNFFPFVSLATQLGKVQTSLSYAVRTRRPNYYLLRSNVEYNNRFTFSTGDPTLKNVIRHEVTLNGRYEWLAFQANYNCHVHDIYDWSYPHNDDGAVLLSWVNLSEPLHRVALFLNASPTLGIWSPNYTIGVQKQWLSMELNDPRTATGKRTVDYNKPIYFFTANNAFRLPTKRDDGKGAWQFELNSELYSGGHYGNAELQNWFWNLSCAVQKSFLPDDALSVRLEMGDIFHTAYNKVFLDFGNYEYRQNHNLGQERTSYDMQHISLTLRYRFNAVKSKYKGTGAGKDAINRM